MKLLTLEMLHMPSRYCCAWMVTELRDPLICPPATVTWTLVLGPEVTEGLWDQPGTLSLSPKGRTEWAAVCPLDSCFAWTLEDDTVYLAGCGKKDVVGRAAMSELSVRMGAWSVCKASCLSWWRGVEHTWQQLTPASWLPGLWSCSNRKVAYPGSCRVNTHKRGALTQLYACSKLISSISHYLFFWKDFLYVVHIFQAHQWSASSVVPDCPPGPSHPRFNHFLFFRMVVCLDWDASPACNLRLLIWFTRHVLISLCVLGSWDETSQTWGDNSEIRLGGIIWRSHRDIPKSNKKQVKYVLYLWSFKNKRAKQISAY